MFKSIAIIALGLLATVGAQDFTVNTPAAIVQCQPVALGWSGGQGPYIVDIIPGGQSTAAPLENVVPSTTGTSTTWTCNLAAGTSITIKVTDSQGNIQYSSPKTILAGSSTSCLNSTATSAAGAAGVTGSAPSGSATSGAASGSSASGSMTSAMSGSSAAAASTSKASSASAMSSSASKSASASGSATSASRSAAASTSGAALKNLEAPGLILAALAGLAALL